MNDSKSPGDDEHEFLIDDDGRDNTFADYEVRIAITRLKNNKDVLLTICKDKELKHQCAMRNP